MGKRNTFEGYLRAHGGRPRSIVSAAVIPVVLAITGLDATAAANGTLTGKFLPKGAIPLSVTVKSNGATGGTTPQFDVGLELSTPDDDGLANGANTDADDVVDVANAFAGALLGTELAETAEVTYGDDTTGTEPTAGTIDLFISYTFADDGVVND